MAGEDGRFLLVLDDGPHAGARYEVTRVAMSLGRDPLSTIPVGADFTRVSRAHAVVWACGAGVRIADKASRNGTFVNGLRVREAEIAVGDEVRLGTDGPRLHLLAAEPAVATERVPQGPPRPALVDRGLYDPMRHRSGSGSLAGTLALATMGAGGGFLAAVLILLSAFGLGLEAAVAGSLAAFLPVPCYLALWLWLDRYDPEPAWILAATFLWGAGAATFLSSIVNALATAIVHSLSGDPNLGDLAAASLSAPFIEEGTKGLAVLIVFWLLRREFDGVLDGIAYAGVVALGFACVENVFYYGEIAKKGGIGALGGLFILRGVLGPFSHALFTSMTGIGLGLAREVRTGATRYLAPVGGYAAAVFLHSLWNTLASCSGSVAGYLVLYALVWVPLFLLFLGVVLWMGARETRIIRKMLSFEVATGLLTEDQVALVGSWGRRLSWVLSSVTRPAILTARRRFLRAATRLALCYWHVERAQSVGAQTLSLAHLGLHRGEIEALKAAVADSA